MADSASPIGVFDSGLGGISVLRELIKVMPCEDFIYYGDSINAPYGVRPVDEVKQLTIDHVNMLLEMGIKGMCVACNTATSAAVKQLRIMYPDLPLVGIEPAIKPAALFKENPSVLVMATPMTIREEKFQTLLSKYKDIARVYQLPCPGLMEYVESGNLEGPELEEFLKNLLKDYAGTDLDAVVLGCTHYPFVSSQIQKTLGDNVQIFDGSLGTARELRRRLTEAGLAKEETETKGSVTILNSDPDHIPLAWKLLVLS